MSAHCRFLKEGDCYGGGRQCVNTVRGTCECVYMVGCTFSSKSPPILHWKDKVTSALCFHTMSKYRWRHASHWLCSSACQQGLCVYLWFMNIHQSPPSKAHHYLNSLYNSVFFSKQSPYSLKNLSCPLMCVRLIKTTHFNYSPVSR